VAGVRRRARSDGRARSDLRGVSRALVCQAIHSLIRALDRGGACFVLAALCLLLAPFFSVGHPGVVWDAFAFLARWVLVVALLLLAVGLLVRHAPATSQTLPWVSLGATIVIASWVIVSLVFYLYLTDLASYESVFGSLASVIVAMAYLYISAIVFLFGAQLDAIIRAQATGTLSGAAAALP
jgi:uncharacterized BrkB/YihY/UPF0761 family membrane protein